MRARDNKHRAEELAAVVRWLRARAVELDEVAGVLLGHSATASEAAALRGKCLDKAAALEEAADAIERGEHHDAAR